MTTFSTPFVNVLLCSKSTKQLESSTSFLNEVRLLFLRNSLKQLIDSLKEKKMREHAWNNT